MNDTPQPKDTLLHVGDLHFWEIVVNPLHMLNKRFIGNLNVLLFRGREFPMDRATEYASVLAGTGVKSALFTGDFTSTSTDNEFAKARGFLDLVRRHGIEPLVLPGNHDVYTFEAAEAKRFEEHFADLIPSSGYPHSAELPGGTPVILVPTVRPNWVSSTGLVTDETVRQVSEMLDTCHGPVIVAAHYPVLDETYGYNLTHQRRLRNAEALHAVLRASGQPVLFVCGHTHGFSCQRDSESPNLSHLSTGAFFLKNRKQNVDGEFCEIHVVDDGFDVFRHMCEAGSWRRTQVKPRPGKN
jgi:3',5'-cyclic AMP phosphodiesterase CpdA